MRIRLETTDRDPFWLIGNPARHEREQMSQAMEENIQVTRNMQDQGGPEWDAREFFDRKNQRLTLSATVRYQFADEIERMDFLARLAAIDEGNQEHLWEGDVWLRNDLRGDAGEYKEWLLPRAVVALAGTKLDAEVGIRLNYNITAGGFAADTRSGMAGLARLVLSGESGMGFYVSASELQSWIDAHSSPTPTRYYITFEMHQGASTWTAYAWFMPTGMGGGGDEFDLPVASSFSDFVTFLSSMLSPYGASVTESGGVMRFVSVAAPGEEGFSIMTITHLYLDAYDVEQEGASRAWTDVEIAFGDSLLVLNDPTTPKIITVLRDT